MAKQLSPNKERFLNFIDQFIKKNGYSPSTAEIQQALNIKSSGTISWYVRELEREGHLLRTRGYSGKRALAIRNDESQKAILPLLGIVAAGYPLEVFENRDEIEVPLQYARPDNYVLKVRGDSMIDYHIQEGDFLIVQKINQAQQGQIVVAYVNEEATLKRYYLKNSHIELHPGNKAYDIIHVSPEDSFRIGGILLYSFREYENRGNKL
jgi:repressor LexA